MVGWRPWMQLVEDRRIRCQQAQGFARRCTIRRALHSWQRAYAQREAARSQAEQEKLVMADAHYHWKLARRGFQAFHGTLSPLSLSSKVSLLFSTHEDGSLC